MQAIYKGVPVSVKNDGSAPGISTSIVFSDAGAFQIQGIFLLGEVKEDQVEKIIPLENVISGLKADFVDFSEGGKINVTRISLEYFSEKNKDNSYTLYPVWSFSCTDSKIELDQGEEQQIDLKYDYMYSAEDGSFKGICY